MKRDEIPFIRITANNNYDFGFQLGKKLKTRIKERIKQNKEDCLKRSGRKYKYYELIGKAKNFLPEIEKNFPDILIEAMAIAKGAKVNFEDMLLLICDQETAELKNNETSPTHCTTIALKTPDNNLLLGHNEDWYPEFKKNGLVLIKGKIKNNEFLALSYIGSLAGTAGGITSNGVAYSDTSFYFSRFDYKVPRAVHLRALLDIKTPKQALETLNCEASIISDTIFIFKKYGIVDVEELWTKEEIFVPKSWIIHTNHPLLKKDRNILHAKEEKESIIRKERACEILMKSKKLNLDAIKNVLSDHKTEICRHLPKRCTKFSTITIASIIMNPKEKWIMLASGNPCKSKYKKYRL